MSPTYAIITNALFSVLLIAHYQRIFVYFHTKPPDGPNVKTPNLILLIQFFPLIILSLCD